MAEPNGISFNPGTYEFRMTVERYEAAAEIRIAISNAITGFSISTPNYVESDPARLTLVFDRVGFLAGGSLDADQVRFSGIEVTVAPISAPTLQVHSSGQVYLINNASETFDLTHYDITSVGDALSPAGWMSLDDQENNDPFGQGWEEAGGSSATVIGEVNLLGETSLASGGRLSLGAAYLPGGAEDLVLRYTAGDGVKRGIVEYVQAGDYNGDGQVNAIDYTLWRDSLRNVVGYNDWRSNFGVSGGAGTANATVPEPMSIIAASQALLAVLVLGRRVRSHLDF
jgi:hypothetical protein